MGSLNGSLLTLGAVAALAVASAGARRGSQNSTTKTLADLDAELRWLGKGLLGEHLLNDTTKSCGSTSSMVAQYLAERGFLVDPTQGAGKYQGHYDLSVQTVDAGWVAVDPTWIQFHAPYDLSVAWGMAEEAWGAAWDAASEAQQMTWAKEKMAPTIGHFRAILADGRAAFEVTPNLHTGTRTHHPSRTPTGALSPPAEWTGATTWREYWQKRADRVDRNLQRLVEGKKLTSGSVFTEMLHETLARETRGSRSRPESRAHYAGWSCVSGPEELLEVLKHRISDLSWTQATRRMILKDAPFWWDGLSKDWSVSYWETRLPSGTPAFIVQASHIEYLFTPSGSLGSGEVALARRMVAIAEDWEEERRLRSSSFERLSSEDIDAIRAAAMAKGKPKGSANEPQRGALRALLAQHAALVGRGFTRGRRAFDEVRRAPGLARKAKIVGGVAADNVGDVFDTHIKTLPALADLVAGSLNADRYRLASDRFFDALEAAAGAKQVVYLGPFVAIGDRKGGIYGNLELSFRTIDTPDERPSDTLGVHLAFIGVPKEARRQGRGRRLLQLVCEAADAAGMRIDLDVDPQRMHGDAKAPVGKVQLRAFYKSLGFTSVRGQGPDYLIRKPQ